MSENENILSVQNLILSNDYKIEEIKNIKLSYIDKTKQKNELELKKIKKLYNCW